MNRVTIKHIQDFETFKGIREDWDRLLENSPLKSAFLTWEWLYGWWKVNRAGRELWLITAWRGNELVGIAPLMLETRKIVPVPMNTEPSPIQTAMAAASIGAMARPAATIELSNP